MTAKTSPYLALHWPRLFQFSAKKPDSDGYDQEGAIMRAQRVWRPAGPDFHWGLKLAPNPYLEEFQKQILEQKARCQNSARFVQSELWHLGSFVREWVGLTLQI